MVLVVDQSPLGDGDVADTLLGEILKAALLAAVSQSVDEHEIAVFKLTRDGVRVRFAVVAQEIAAVACDRIAAGESWGAVLAAMHPGGVGA